MKSIFALAGLLISSNLFAFTPIYTLQTGLGYDDIDDASDTFYYLTGAAAISNTISNNSLFDFQAEISTYDYSDNDDVSSDEIFLQGTYSYTPWAGFRAPTFSAALRYLEEFANNDDFDASTLSLILSAAYRIDDRTRLLGGLKVGDRDSDTALESDPTGYYINLDLLYSPQLLLYATLGADEGAFTIRSYCSGAYNADAYRGGRYNNRYNRRYSGSGDCDNSYLNLGGNYTFNANSTIDAALGYNDYDTPIGNLDGFIYSVDYFYRF